MKLCGRCKEVKSYDEYYKGTGNSTGIGAYCKLCSPDVLREKRFRNGTYGPLDQRTGTPGIGRRCELRFYEWLKFQGVSCELNDKAYGPDLVVLAGDDMFFVEIKKLSYMPGRIRSGRVLRARQNDDYIAYALSPDGYVICSMQEHLDSCGVSTMRSMGPWLRNNPHQINKIPKEWLQR